MYNNMVASTSRSSNVATRADAPSSRRSISSQAASASRSLAASAASSFSSPYGGLPSSASSSSSLSTPTRHSISSTSRNSLSRCSILSPSPSATSPAAAIDNPTQCYFARPSGTTSCTKDIQPSASTRRVSNDAIATKRSTEIVKPPIRPSRSAARSSAERASRRQRPRSVESLRLDLDGLDLGGNPPFSSPLDPEVALYHVRTRSSNAQRSSALPLPLPHPALGIPTYRDVDVDPDRLCVSCSHKRRPHETLNGGEDSFSLHLREECSDYREILSSQAILNAVVDKEQRMLTASVDPLNLQRQRAYSISHGQVLGGFASLGPQTESAPIPPAPSSLYCQQPMRPIPKGSTDESETSVTPIEWRDSFGTSSASAYATPPQWAHLTARPCNPLEPLDVLSIEEMGLHSLDIGSLNDWEGCKLSAEILCPVKGHQRIEWSVAQTTRRSKKWVVVPNATITCGASEPLTPAAQAERTVIVSKRSLWLDEAEAAGAPLVLSHVTVASSSSLSLSSSQRQADLGASDASYRNALPFSGKACFELRLLRPTVGKVYPMIYLANASTHRYLHNHRRDVGQRQMQPEDQAEFDTKALAPGYHILRRSRSRPYLRRHQVPLRRSHSRPSLSDSAEQTAPLQPEPTGINTEVFAPSLPGDPLLRTCPGESWPSARVRRSESISSFQSDSSGEAGSDTSEDDARLSVTNTRESMTGSTTSDSYDQPVCKEGEPVRSVAIPMPVGGAHGGVPTSGAVCSVSPSSSSSRGLSNTSELSSSLVGWQAGSLDQPRHGKQANGMSHASYEADSWQGTSPTTASASSLSASSKQSRGRKGLQKALLKKDKMLSSWFKRRPENGATLLSVSPVTDCDKAQPGAAVGVIEANVRLTGAGGEDGDVAGAVGHSIALTETALETFQRAMFRPVSPDSTIMGSRRGSEALTQKAGEAPAQVYGHGTMTRSVVDGGGEIENRQAVNSTLSQVYGWDQQQVRSKSLQRATVGGSALMPTFFEDTDETDALVGLDAVPAGALTMLIPLPLIGRDRVEDVARYMRVNFSPFKSLSDDFETGAPGIGHAASAGHEAEGGLVHSVSTGSSQLAERTGMKSSEHSSWKRKLGLSSHRSGGSGSSGGVSANTSTSNASTVSSGARSTVEAALASPPVAMPKFEAFRITAIVHDAPRASDASMDARLPEPGTFPVVLGYCNHSQGLEMVPEGWDVLKLAGVSLLTKQDNTPLDSGHPLRGVTDVIIAACRAVMDG